MNIVSRVKRMSEKISDECSLFMIRHPRGYLMMTAFLGVLSLIVLFAPDARAQLETQVTDALNPLARLLVGPVAKGLAIVGLFAFVGLALCRALDGCGVFIGCGGDSWSTCQYRHGDLPGLQRRQLYIGRLIHATPSADDRQTDRAPRVSHG